MQHDDLLLNAALGDGYERDLKEGMYSSLSKNDVAELLFKSSLATAFYPKDKDRIIETINRLDEKKDKYDETDIVYLSR